MKCVSNDLPSKFTKRNFTKHALADILIDTFFILVVIASTSVVLHSCSLALGRALDAFMKNLVRVCNYCEHVLSNEVVMPKALQLETITGMSCINFISVCVANSHSLLVIAEEDMMVP